MAVVEDPVNCPSLSVGFWPSSSGKALLVLIRAGLGDVLGDVLLPNDGGAGGVKPSLPGAGSDVSLRVLSRSPGCLEGPVGIGWR